MTRAWHIDVPYGGHPPIKDGLGFSLSCDAVPLTGRIVMRRIEAKAEGAGGQQ